MYIKDYEDYLIFNDGTVYSCKSKQFMRTHINHKGYEMVRLCKYGKHKGFQVHRLVALHFIPNPEEKPFVDHINCIRDDNRVENLRWATACENGQNRLKKPKNIKYRPHTNGYEIVIKRNKLTYYKYCKTETEAIIQRDLMLSMFNYLL
jgi:hypothetical protein